MPRMRSRITIGGSCCAYSRSHGNTPDLVSCRCNHVHASHCTPNCALDCAHQAHSLRCVRYRLLHGRKADSSCNGTVVRRGGGAKRMNADLLRGSSLLEKSPVCLTKEMVAKVLGIATHNIPPLVRAGLLKPLGRPGRFCVKYFSRQALAENMVSEEWLGKVVNAINRHWQNKNARRRSRPVDGQSHRGRVHFVATSTAAAHPPSDAKTRHADSERDS